MHDLVQNIHVGLLGTRTLDKNSYKIAQMATKAKLSKSYLHVPRKTPFTGLTVGQQLYKSAEKFGNKEMYVFCEDNERISFQQMKDKV